MNGRIYDPILGRFLQADQHINAPTNSQNENRYSYALNSPTSYSDSGDFSFKKRFLKPFIIYQGSIELFCLVSVCKLLNNLYTVGRKVSSVNINIKEKKLRI